MSYYPKPDSHIRDKLKVILDFFEYQTYNILFCGIKLLWI